MNASTRRSGWLRLWVLVGALYALVVIVLATILWPSSDSGIKTYTATDHTLGDQFSFDFHGFRPPSDSEMTAVRLAQLRALSRSDPGLDKSKGDVAPGYLSTDPMAGLPITEVTRVEIEGREPVYFRKDTTESTMDRAVNLHVNGPWPERLRFIGWASFAWAAPMAFVYALGRGIGWVVRGFRQQ